MAAERIMSDKIAQALWAAGILDAEPGTYRRIVLDLQAGRLAVLYTDQYARPAWLDVVRTLDGVEVTTTPGPAAGNVLVEVPYLDGRPGEQIDLTQPDTP